MYLRFRLPRTHASTGQLSADRLNKNMRDVALQWISEQLHTWAANHGCEYTLHQRDDAIYAEFDNDSMISMFMLTWEPRAHSTSWKRITVVDTIVNTVDAHSERSYEELMDDVKVDVELMNVREELARKIQPEPWDEA